MEREVTYQGRKVKGTEVQFDTVREEWNIYELNDGSTLKIKTVLSGVLRIDGEYNSDGDPVYVTKTANHVVSSVVPDHLRKEKK